MMRKEEKKSARKNSSGKHIVAQVHLLSERIREGSGWMSYREK
jgi:hypothetical protein